MPTVLRKVVINARQYGFKWRIVRGGQELRSGSVGTRAEAEAGAQAALKELEAQENKRLISN
jgi:hypothetical protein